MDDELKPCPFCNCTDIQYGVNKQWSYVQIFCTGCGAQTAKMFYNTAQIPYAYNAKVIVNKLWNERS